MKSEVNLMTIAFVILAIIFLAFTIKSWIDICSIEHQMLGLQSNSQELVSNVTFTMEKFDERLLRLEDIIYGK